MSHGFCRSLYTDTCIGEFCFIGSNAIIMAGINIVNNVIIGSGAVVTKNVQFHCIVTGNHARTIKEHIQTRLYGQIIEM
jgi:acetyltransferase-like isoleucine patch superfamily enzyme